MNQIERGHLSLRVAAIALSAILGLSAFGLCGTKAVADEAAGASSIQYLDEYGFSKDAPEGCTDFVTAIGDGYRLEGGWYYVPESAVFEKRVFVDGDVHLIICDGATLEVRGGINVWEDTSLTIYSQSGKSGKLIADASLNEDGDQYDDRNWQVHDDEYSNHCCAGIGGRFTNAYSGEGRRDCGRVTICGCDVVAKGGGSAAGIGGSLFGSGGEVIVRGGNVQALGGRYYGAGIGGGMYGNGGKFTIYDGDVYAEGASYDYGEGGAGIGGGALGDSALVEVLGGTIDAHAGTYAAAIGAGSKREASQPFIMYGGVVTAQRKTDNFYDGGSTIGDGHITGDKTLPLLVKLHNRLGVYDRKTSELLAGPDDDPTAVFQDPKYTDIVIVRT